VEIGSWTASIAALDAAMKAGTVRVLQIELNDLLGVSMKLAGETADVDAALRAADATARVMGASVAATAIRRPHAQSPKLWPLVDEYNPLIEQNVAHVPREQAMPEQHAPYAIGLIETQGYTAVIEAIDTACKAAS